jgi:hypothetical protein
VDTLVAALTDICDRFSRDPAVFLDKKLHKKEYMDTHDQFHFMTDLVISLFNKKNSE